MAAENSLPTINRRDLDFQLFEHLEIGSLTARPYFADHDRATMTAALDTAQVIAAQHFQTHNRKAKIICRFPQRPSFWLSAYKAQILNPSLADFAGKRPQIETIAARWVPGGDGLRVSCRAGSDGSTPGHALHPRPRRAVRRSDRRRSGHRA